MEKISVTDNEEFLLHLIDVTCCYVMESNYYMATTTRRELIQNAIDTYEENYVINLLNDLKKEHESIRFYYYHVKSTNSHIVKVEPLVLYDQDEYGKAESEAIMKFVSMFPTSSLSFHTSVLDFNLRNSDLIKIFVK